MPYYKSINLLFIHIPKTGGTVIENSIKKDKKYGIQTLYSTSSRNSILPAPFSTYSLQHQFYSTIYDYRIKLNVNFDKIKVFSVVRNPYDRIISDLFHYKLIKPNFSKEEVFNIIKNKYIYKKKSEMHKYDNHVAPQYLYVTDNNEELIKNIKIFHTETLNENNDELNSFAGININIKQSNVNKDYSKYLNNDSILLINEIYKKDFELFGYEMIT
jgi:hypothetical protein